MKEIMFGGLRKRIEAGIILLGPLKSAINWGFYHLPLVHTILVFFHILIISRRIVVHRLHFSFLLLKKGVGYIVG